MLQSLSESWMLFLIWTLIVVSYLIRVRGRFSKKLLLKVNALSENNWCRKYVLFDRTKIITTEIILIFLQVITNLTQALEMKKERIELMRKFTLWRIQQLKAKQEVCVQNTNVMKMKPLNSKVRVGAVPVTAGRNVSDSVLMS